MKLFQLSATVLLMGAVAIPSLAEEIIPLGEFPHPSLPGRTATLELTNAAAYGEEENIVQDILRLRYGKKTLWQTFFTRFGGCGVGLRDFTDAVFYDEKIYLGHNIYLLALDSATGRVLERHLLPGEATELATGEEDALEINYKYYGAFQSIPGSETIRFEKGKFDRPVYPYGNYMWRLRLMREGESRFNEFSRQARSCIPCPGDEPTFLNSKTVVFDPTEGETPCPDPDVLPEDAEVIYWGASEHDPTNPWHRFFLGQALYYQERKKEASEIWDEMFAGYKNIPYWNFAWMASKFERLGQRELADKAFEKTKLLYLKQVPYAPPPRVTTVETMINFPVLRTAAWMSQAGDLERAHLWLERCRGLFGSSMEWGFLPAKPWERHFLKNGNKEKADREAEWATLAFKNPLDHWGRASIYMDYAFYFLPVLGFTMGWVALWSLVYGWRRIKPTLSPLVVRERWFPTLGRAVRFAWASRYAFRGVPWRARVPVFVCMALMLLLLACVTWYGEAVATAYEGFPDSLMDSLGHSSTVTYFDDLARNDSAEARFAAAYANHLAGNRERAEELYALAASHPGSASHLAALRSGKNPPEPLSPQDIASACLSQVKWHDVVGMTLGYLPLLTFFPELFMEGDLADMDLMDVLMALTMFLAAFANVVFIAFLVVLPARLHDSMLPPGSAIVRRWFRRLVFLLVPGTIHLWDGKAFRGVLLVFLFILPLISGFWLFTFVAPEFMCLGILTCISLPNLQDSYPLPPFSVVQDASQSFIARLASGTMWLLPGAKLFFSFVLASVVIVLVWHIASIRRILRS
jgi:tetratricopeptide (TPR) repeat protein